MENCAPSDDNDHLANGLELNAASQFTFACSMIISKFSKRLKGPYGWVVCLGPNFNPDPWYNVI